MARLTAADYRDLSKLATVSLKESKARHPREMDEPSRLETTLTEAFEKKAFVADDFSLQQLWIHSVPDGREALHLLEGKGNTRLHESAVDTAAFANITNQLLSSIMREPLVGEEMPFTNLIPTRQTRWNGEKIGSIANIGDIGQVVDELAPYPKAGMSEDWIETPKTTKRGVIIEVSKEAIFFDLTGDILTRARQVSMGLAIGREKRAIDCLIDENRTTHRYKWRGTSYATYQTSTPWDNVTASNALVDWSDIENANQTFNGLLDPMTGEPVMIEPKLLICTKDLEQTARRILNATGLVVHVGGFPTSGNPSQTAWKNPYSFDILSTRRLASRLATDTDWFYGDPARAFAYMENWARTTAEAPVNSKDEFERDVAIAVKASERGEYVVLEPRFMSKSTA